MKIAYHLATPRLAGAKQIASPPIFWRIPNPVIANTARPKIFPRGPAGKTSPRSIDSVAVTAITRRTTCPVITDSPRRTIALDTATLHHPGINRTSGHAKTNGIARTAIAGENLAIASPTIQPCFPKPVAANQSCPGIFPTRAIGHAFALKSIVAPTAGAGGTADGIATIPRIAIAVLSARRQICRGGTGKLACLMIYRKRCRRQHNDKPRDNDFFHYFNSYAVLIASRRKFAAPDDYYHLRRQTLPPNHCPEMIIIIRRREFTA